MLMFRHDIDGKIYRLAAWTESTKTAAFVIILLQQHQLDLCCRPSIHIFLFSLRQGAYLMLYARSS
jgi:hypothetical protein